jgi:hypothetical protein
MKLLLIIATTVSTVVMADYRTQNQNSNAWKTPLKLQECILEMPGVDCTEGDDEDPEPMLFGEVKDNNPFPNPFHNACVELKTTGGVLIANTGTNINGHYYFNSVVNGVYNIVVTVSGHVPSVVPVTVSGTPQNVPVTVY